MTHNQKHTKQFRGKKADFFSGDMRMCNFTWGSSNQPTILTTPEGFDKSPKGIWIYPKKGFIKWQSKK